MLRLVNTSETLTTTITTVPSAMLVFKLMLGLQNFLRDKFPTWANNGSSVEDIWKNLKEIVFEGIE